MFLPFLNRANLFSENFALEGFEAPPILLLFGVSELNADICVAQEHKVKVDEGRTLGFLAQRIGLSKTSQLISHWYYYNLTSMKNNLADSERDSMRGSPSKYCFMFEEKENNISHNNVSKEDGWQPKYHRSTSSTHQATHPKASVQNLYTHRLESQILQLQKSLDQQQFQIQTLSEESNFYLNTCESQKETLLGLNIEAMRQEYEQQIRQLSQEREKVQEIIFQLKQDYQQAYERQEAELNSMKLTNEALSQQIESALARKKALLTLLSSKANICHELEVEARESEERLDELRNVERKLLIAMKEIERIHPADH